MEVNRREGAEAEDEREGAGARSIPSRVVRSSLLADYGNPTDRTRKIENRKTREPNLPLQFQQLPKRLYSDRY